MSFDDTRDQPCMNCGAAMLSNARFDADGHLAVNTLTQIELQQADEDVYFKCQRCGAKNCVELETGANGLPHLRLTQVKP
jgi:hypothetical protein